MLTPLNIRNGILIGLAVFAQLKAESPYTLQWAPLSRSKLPCRIRRSGLHLTLGSLNPPEPTTQTASRWVQPFISRLTIITERQTDRLTDDATPSIATSRIYYCDAALCGKIHS